MSLSRCGCSILRATRFSTVCKLNGASVLQFSTSRVRRNEDEDEKLAENPYYEKYADKIKRVQGSSEYQQKAAMQAKVTEDKRLRQEMEQWRRHQEMLEGKFSSASDTDDEAKGSKLPKNLNELMKLELLADKSAEDIGEFWIEYYKQQDCISAVIPAETYRTMEKLATVSPTFLYPVPKSEGYEFILAQFAKHRCFFSPLINYQVHGENAPWHLCLTHYTELIDSKGIVLMTSELDTKNMNQLEAQFLSMLVQTFYSSDDSKHALVHAFNHSPDSFDHMSIVRAIEDSNLAAKPRPSV